MAIPNAVRKAAEEADRLQQELYGQADNPQESTDDSGEETPVAEEPTVKAAPQEELQDTNSEEPTPEPAPQPQADDPNSETWQHKYKVLQGMYNAEVPRMHQQIKDLKGEIDSLKKQKDAEPASAEPAPTRLLKDEEIEEFGPDLVDVIRRAAREEFLPELDSLRTENAQLKGEVGTVTQNLSASARQHVYDRLSEQVSNWNELNSDADFLVWLNQNDPYAGRTRNELLQAAFESNDAERVVAFFKGYLNELNATVTPSTQAVPVNTPAPAKVAVDTLVAPGSPGTVAGTGSAAQEANTRIWTQAQISKFYRDVQKGAYRGKDSEKEQIEREIVQAINEHRIGA
jgi:hypothetical protein